MPPLVSPPLPPPRSGAASSYALYGERLGLLGEGAGGGPGGGEGAQRFLEALETMLRTTLPLLFVPPPVMRRLHPQLWREHLHAWDTIFQHGGCAHPEGDNPPPPRDTPTPRRGTSTLGHPCSEDPHAKGTPPR